MPARSIAPVSWSQSLIDQGLKERLTGAIVLVVLGVLFIPLFLDGPDRSPEASESRALILPAAQDRAGRDAAPQTSAKKPEDQPGSNRAADVAKAETAAAASTGSEQIDTAGAGKAKVAEPEDDKRVPSPAAATENVLNAWAVQVGSFASQDNAERLSQELKSRGYRAFVTRLSTSGQTMFRVRVGPEQERERAEDLARRLKKDGHRANVVPHP